MSNNEKRREELANAFIGRDLSSLNEPLPKNPKFEKLINDCPFCGDEVNMFATQNNLLMNGTWNIDCNGCNLSMREDFILGKEKEKARVVILKRWNKRD